MYRYMYKPVTQDLTCKVDSCDSVAALHTQRDNLLYYTSKNKCAIFDDLALHIVVHKLIITAVFLFSGQSRFSHVSRLLLILMLYSTR